MREDINKIISEIVDKRVEEKLDEELPKVTRFTDTEVLEIEYKGFTWIKKPGNTIDEEKEAEYNRMTGRCD